MTHPETDADFRARVLAAARAQNAGPNETRIVETASGCSLDAIAKRLYDLERWAGAPNCKTLETHARQFDPPTFDAQVATLLTITNRHIPERECSAILRATLRAAFLDGVLAALKDRARAQGVDLP